MWAERIGLGFELPGPKLGNLGNSFNSGKWIKSFRIWWTRGDSNPRPPRCERGALPAELLAHEQQTDFSKRSLPCQHGREPRNRQGRNKLRPLRHNRNVYLILGLIDRAAHALGNDSSRILVQRPCLWDCLDGLLHLRVSFEQNFEAFLLAKC